MVIYRGDVFKIGKDIGNPMNITDFPSGYICLRIKFFRYPWQERRDFPSIYTGNPD